MKLYTTLLALLAAAAVNAHAAGVNISKIEPANWWTGLKSTQLQLMVYGPDIKGADVSVSYPGVALDSVVRLTSPNYLLVYLTVGSDAQPGKVALNFAQGGKKKTVQYPLLEREMSGDKRQGFTNQDVLYILMPDRFADGNSKLEHQKGLAAYTVDRNEPSLRHGGDLEGIRQHLDYFNELGVTALWLTPVLENNTPDHGRHSTYHGYATTDYYRVDPRFGTNADYRRLVDEAHSKGLKVVMDMIFNHCGITHPWKADEPSHDWFNWREGDDYRLTSYKLTPILDPYASRIDREETEHGWFVPTMPDLNQDNPHVMRYLIQNSIWWIETVGIDGIRMDTYPYASAHAMATWMKELDTVYPNFNVVGETWVTEPAYTAAWQKGSPLAQEDSYLKTVMDFAFFDRLTLAKGEETDGWWQGFNRLYNSFCYDYLYPNPSSVMAFIENHDTDRFLGDGNDVPALKQALALLLTVRRIPQLYYGTEVLMGGTKTVTDGNVRRDMMGGWQGDERSVFTAQGRTAAEQEMFQWLSRLLHWRQGNQVVTQGTMTQFCPHQGVYVVARRHQGRTVLTVLNGTSAAATMAVDRYAEVIGGHTAATDVTTGNTVSLAADIALQPRQVMVLEF